MPDLSHFAINADDVPATRRFYESVFGWRFEAWGPPDFFQITTPGEGAPRGALHKRRDLVAGERTIGFECTVDVPDLDTAIAAALAAGGRVVMEPSVITGVGRLAFVADPSGNVVGMMAYEQG